MGRSARLALPVVVLAAVVAACAPTATDNRSATETSDAPSSSQEASPDPGATSDDGDDTDAPDSAGSTDGAPPSGQDLVAQASHLDVGGRALSGGDVELADFVGSPVALWMWTPW